MKKIYLLLTLVSIANLGYSQNVLFYDNFNNSTYTWKPSSNAYVNSGSSRLYIAWNQEPSNNNGSIICPIELNQNDDFTIETSMTLKEGAIGNGIVWNYKNDNEFYRFLITDRDGQYVVNHYQNGDKESLVSWTTSSTINQKFARNKLEIRKQGSKTSFYINGSLVNSVDNINYDGSRLGIYLGALKDAKLEVDYYKITTSKGTTNYSNSNLSSGSRKDTPPRPSL